MTDKIYEIRRIWIPYYCILWVNHGQNMFILNDYNAEDYKAVKDYEDNRRFSSIKELYDFVYNLRYGKNN